MLVLHYYSFGSASENSVTFLCMSVTVLRKLALTSWMQKGFSFGAKGLNSQHHHMVPHHFPMHDNGNIPREFIKED